MRLIPDQLWQEPCADSDSFSAQKPGQNSGRSTGCRPHLELRSPRRPRSQGSAGCPAEIGLLSGSATFPSRIFASLAAAAETFGRRHRAAAALRRVLTWLCSAGKSAQVAALSPGAGGTQTGSPLNGSPHASVRSFRWLRGPLDCPRSGAQTQLEEVRIRGCPNCLFRIIVRGLSARQPCRRARSRWCVQALATAATSAEVCSDGLV